MSYLKSKTNIIIALAIISFSSCKNRKENPNTENTFDYSMVILNEGNFGKGNAEITLYNSAIKTSSKDVFEKINGRPLGDVGQSIYLFNEHFFILLNNSSKIEIVDKNFKSVQVINNIELPRYMIFKGNKGYVSSWGNGGQVYVINPFTYKILKTISTGQGSEKMLLHNDFLYVANGGGFGYDSTISVINTNSDTYVKSIFTGDNPKEIVLQDDNHIWVLNFGKYSSDWTEISGKSLILLNLTSDTKEKIIDVPTNSTELNSLYLKDNFLYFNHSGIYRLSINSNELPSEPFINSTYNSFQFNSEKTVLYGFTTDWVQKGNVYLIDIQTGNKIRTVETGVAPNFVIGVSGVAVFE